MGRIYVGNGADAQPDAGRAVYQGRRTADAGGGPHQIIAATVVGGAGAWGGVVFRQSGGGARRADAGADRRASAGMAGGSAKRGRTEVDPAAYFPLALAGMAGSRPLAAAPCRLRRLFADGAVAKSASRIPARAEAAAGGTPGAARQWARAAFLRCRDAEYGRGGRGSVLADAGRSERGAANKHGSGADCGAPEFGGARPVGAVAGVPDTRTGGRCGEDWVGFARAGATAATIAGCFTGGTAVSCPLAGA